MLLPHLVVKNAFRHKLRTTLTVVGIVVAITAFGLLRTIVDAWYSGANASSSARLVTRSSVSLVFPLPLTYAQKLRQVPGVAAVTWANWFGGVYVSERNFFPQFAVDAPTYLDIYPEIVLAAEERKAWLRDRKGASIGRQLADARVEDGRRLPLRGTIFPGTWTFVVRGIYDGADATTDHAADDVPLGSTSTRRCSKSAKQRVDQVGIYIVGVTSRPAQARRAWRARSMRRFATPWRRRSPSPSRPFNWASSRCRTTIIAAIRTVSYVVIAIILAVMANTMAMSARERVAEYATLKALRLSAALHGGAHLRRVGGHRALEAACCASR